MRSNRAKSDELIREATRIVAYRQILTLTSSAALIEDVEDELGGWTLDTREQRVALIAYDETVLGITDDACAREERGE